MRKCDICGGDHAIHEIDGNPVIRFICSGCKEMLHTHVCFLCAECTTYSWMPKTAENVMLLANHMGTQPKEIMEQEKLIVIPQCKSCFTKGRGLYAVP